MSRKKKNEQELPVEEAVDAPDDSVSVDEVILSADETDISDADTSTTNEDLDTILMQRDQFKDALQRERADFVNYKKRVEREKSEMRSTIAAETLAKVLPIIDDFDRAMTSVPDDAQDNGWLTGLTMIHRKFNELLTQFGIETIDPLGEPFDPNFHEAIGTEDSDEYESNTITAVLQKGYKLDDKCIRVAMVKVAN